MDKAKLDDKEEFCIVDIGKMQTNGEIRTLTTEIVLKYCTGPQNCIYGKLQIEYNPEKKYIVKYYFKQERELFLREALMQAMDILFQV